MLAKEGRTAVSCLSYFNPMCITPRNSRPSAQVGSASAVQLMCTSYQVRVATSGANYVTLRQLPVALLAPGLARIPYCLSARGSRLA